MLVGIGKETKGYSAYLPKDNVVVTTQHAKNIETLDKKQNENVQKLYLQNETPAADSKRGTPPASGEKDTSVGTAIGRAKRRGKKMKSP
ncbi:hypothetical protein PI124_g16095 [Phytophthora idaei]|nr:hypothetical protein PI125_g15245 [Phytophthora idaei]KAG3144468.1 hypothetical protein PI126_g14152 [Phytophthora idaei]KAG3238956.1 hypothetical protein PI124_g16095 [Phytophthora idaei]